MNSLAWMILIALISRLLVDLVASLLNLRALTGEVLAEITDTFDAETYAKSQAYSQLPVLQRIAALPWFTTSQPAGASGSPA